MGLFSSKTKHTVGVQVFRLVENAGLPDTTLAPLLKSIFRGTNISEELLAAALNAPFRSFEQTYNYASEPGNYAYGLPDAKLLVSSAGLSKLKGIIEAETGQDVTVDYAFYTPMNNVHFALKELQDSYGYSASSNEIQSISLIKGYPVYLDRIVAIHSVIDGDAPEPDTLGIYSPEVNAGVTPERSAMTPLLSQYSRNQETILSETLPESAEIHYIWEDAAGILFKESFTYDLSDIDATEEFYQVKYTYIAQGVTYLKFWTYSSNQALHPELDSVFDVAYPGTGTYFPIFLFRDNFTNLVAPTLHETAEFKSSVKTAAKLGIDYQQFGEDIHSNPDIADVQHAAVIMGVPITTEDPIEVEYLYHYFNQWVTNAPELQETLSSFKQRNALHTAPERKFAIRIGDGNFSMIISMKSVQRSIVVGSLGDIGTYSASTSSQQVSGIAGLLGNQGVPTTSLFLRKQISLDKYTEIKVVRPIIRYPADSKHHYAAAVNDGNALIPLDYNIARLLSTNSREKLYLRSLHLVAVSHVVQKIKWYESSFFRAVLLVVSVVITILTVGTVFQQFALVFATTTAAVVATAIVLVLAELAITFTFKKVVDVIGAEAALALAAVLVAVGVAKGIKASAFPNTLTAQQALAVATNLTKSVGRNLGESLTDLFREEQDFQRFIEGKYSDLDTANDLLNDVDLSDAALFVGSVPLTVMGESPDDFYRRTIHNSNPGTLVFNYIENFVESSLTLPTSNKPSGGGFYE